MPDIMGILMLGFAFVWLFDTVYLNSRTLTEIRARVGFIIKNKQNRRIVSYNKLRVLNPYLWQNQKPAQTFTIISSSSD